MSRRKQSNPKPLKREDEEDSPTPEALDKPSEPSSAKPKGLLNPERSPSNPPTSPHSSGDESPVPRLRLNTSLATDPALRSDAMTVKTEITSPNSEVNPVRGPSAADLEYLASIPSAFQHALATAGRLFPPSQLPEGDALNLPKTRNKQEPPSAVVIESRAVPVFMCTPCGIRFSSASTLEAHQTYYCSHRVQMKGRGDSDGDDPKSPQNAAEDGETVSKVLRTGKQYGCPYCSYSADKKVSLNRHMRMHSSSPAAPMSMPVPVILPSPLQNGVEQPATNPSQLVDRYCQDCDIRFYSVKTLKAHKMHYCSSRYAKGSPPSKNSSTPTSPSEPQRLSPEPPPPPPPPPLPPHQPRHSRSNEQPFLILRTNPILIVPYSLLQSASVFTGASPNLPSHDTPCILMPNGTVQPMSNLVSQLSTEKDLSKNSNHQTKQGLKMREESPPAKSVRTKSEVAPLDLSVRRSSESSELVIDMEDEKENVFTSSPRQEETPSMPPILGRPLSPDKLSEERKHSDSYSSTPSPNLPPSPNSKKSPRRTPNGISTSGKSKEGRRMGETEFQNCFSGEQPSRRNSIGGKSVPVSLLPSQLPLLLPGASPELLNQASLLPLLSTDLRIPGLVGPQTISESSVPQILVKQGVSKCQECNIVFCKHENYIAHKKHYCSSRLPDLSSDENSRTSPATSKSPGSGTPKDPSSDNSKGQAATPPSVKPPTLQYQFICVACSISFTSLDNLTTHQTYYCTKRSSESLKPGEEKGRRCGKCKALVNGDHQCAGPCVNPAVTGWKCPCCDVVSPTAAAAQKHMDTHQGVRAFRCTICKYKGNTLRGMRTHIRMHFDKKNSDLQEENYISCILDEESEQHQHPPPSSQQIQNNGVVDSPKGSQVTVKVEVGAEEEFVEVDVVEPPFEGEHTGEEEDKGHNSNNNVKKVNYCKSCDISFNYLSSLIAHKKFYCSATSAEGEPQSKSSRTTPETSVQ